MKSTTTLLSLISALGLFPFCITGQTVVFADDFETATVGDSLTAKPLFQAGWRAEEDMPYMTEIFADTGDFFGKGTVNQMLRIGRTAVDPGLAGITDFSVTDLPVGDVLTLSFLFYTDDSGKGEVRMRLRGDQSTSIQTIEIKEDGEIDNRGNLSLETYLGDGNTEGDSSGTVGRPMRVTFVFNESPAAITYDSPSGGLKTLASRTVDIWVDGVLRIEGYADPSSVVSNVNRIMFRFNDITHEPVFYLDDFMVIDGAVADPVFTGRVSERGWHYTGERFNWVYNSVAPWYYSLDHGWLYFNSSNDEDTFYYHAMMDGAPVGWVFTNKAIFPYVYSHRLANWGIIAVSDERDINGVPLTRTFAFDTDTFVIGQ